MFPSPSCGSPPKCCGARVKFWILVLTTTARFVCRAPLRGETIATLGSPGSGGCSLPPPSLPPISATARAAAAATATTARMAIAARIGVGRLRAGRSVAAGAAAPTPKLSACCVRLPSRWGRCSRSRWPLWLRRRPGRATRSASSPAPSRAAAPSAAGTTSPLPPCPSGWSSGAPTRFPRNAIPAVTTTAIATCAASASPTSAAPGAPLYGDFPFLPTTEPIDASPAAAGVAGLKGRFQPGFSHAQERAQPGLYSVRLNPVGGGAIDAALTATTRTGMARFSFPGSPHASVLIDAGGSAKANDLAEVQIDPSRREISGSASSGYFCAQRPRYRVYFAATFSRPFDAYGTWTRQKLAPGSTAAVDERQPSTVAANTAQAGAYASFDTRRNRTVGVRVGVSFVSVAGARANLAAEDRSASFGAVRTACSRRVESCSVFDRRRRRRARRRRNLLHGALPRVPLSPYVQRRRWPLHRHGRGRAPCQGAHPVRGFLRLGHLPHADPAAGDADAAPRRRHRRLDAGRRKGERLPAALVLRERAEHDDGRRSGRPDHRLGGRLRRSPLRRRRGAGSDAEGRRRRLQQRRWQLRRATGPRPVQGTRLRALRPRRRGGAMRTRCSGTPKPSGHRRRPPSSTRSTTSRLPSSPPAHSATRSRIAPSCCVQETGAISSTRSAARSSPASKMGPSPPTTTTSMAPASPRATPPSTPGWCPRTPPASSPRSAVAPLP